MEDNLVELNRKLVDLWGDDTLTPSQRRDQMTPLLDQMEVQLQTLIASNRGRITCFASAIRRTIDIYRHL
jgi:hypothetical protein